MIFYNGVNVLSMSNEELAIRIKNGSAELVGELWEKTSKILYKLANAYYSRLQADFTRCGVTKEDLCQECYIAFVGMLQAFDEEKGYKFITYAELQLKNRVNELLGKRTGENNKPLDNASSLDNEIKGFEGEELILLDTIPDETAQQSYKDIEAEIFNTELHNALESVMSKHLNAEQKTVIKARFYDNLTLKQAGELVGANENRAVTVERDGLRALRWHKRELSAFAEHYITDFAYHFTSQGSFKSKLGSSQELIIERLDLQERYRHKMAQF